jgi:Rieske Fe-S protein
MSEEDQERLEDYLELEHFIEELQAGRVAHLPEGLTPDKARVYRMAALLRSAVPEEAMPRADFAAELRAKLEHEVQQPPRTRHLPFLAKKPQGRARVSRRAVLAGGAAAVAASLAVGAGLEHVVEQAANTAPPPAAQWSTPIVPAGIASTWLFVTTLAALGDQAVRFATDSIVGYVMRNDGDDKAAGNEPVVAMSAACTHMGCIVQWQAADHTFRCPCHGGLFTEYGMIDKHSPLLYLKPLPRFETKVEEGKVFVRVPASQTS